MGLLDSIGALVQGAIPAAIATRTGYLRGEQEEEDRKLQEARQASLDKEQLAYRQSQENVDNARADAYRAAAGDQSVEWHVDSQGNLIPFPKKLPRDGSTPATPSVLSKMKSDVGFNPTVPSAAAMAHTLNGGSMDDSETPSQGGGVLSKLKADTGVPTVTAPDQQAPTFKIGQPSGVKARTPSEPLTAIIGDDGKPTLVARSQAVGKTPYRPTGDSPHTLVTDQGIMQYDKATDSWKPTGFTRTPVGRSGAGSQAQQRLDAKTALDEETKLIPRPSKVPQPHSIIFTKDADGNLKAEPNPLAGQQSPLYQKTVADSINFERNTLDPLRQHLLDVTTAGDPTVGGTNPSAQTPVRPLPTGRQPISADAQKAMAAEYQTAADNLNTVLGSSLGPELKAQARKAYNQHLAAIAKKYGTASSGTP